MHNFRALFLFALAAFTQWQGTLGKDLQSGYVCLIDDPNPSQCDNFSLTELRAQLNQVVKAQDLGNTRDADIQAKLNSVVNQLQEMQTYLNGQQKQVEAISERQQTVLTKMEESQTKLQDTLLVVQTRVENQLQTVLNQIENQLLAVSKNIDAANVENSDLVRASLSGFQRIGDRYFLIVNEWVTWHAACKRCRKLGGYLASFQNEAEFSAVKAKLGNNFYWIGIHDWGTEGHFLSEASGNPAQFLRWRKGDPDDKNHKQNCVLLHRDSGMWDHDCSSPYYFICQADNKT